MKNLLKTKVTIEMEFKQDINKRLNEINARSLLISFNTPWTVRKILARTNTLRQYTSENGTNIFISKYLNKDEQLNEKQCLSQRWQLITDEQYEKDNFKINNLKLFYD